MRMIYNRNIMAHKSNLIIN
uniref:Uncharacterized protein n=1 Tax=Anguilla anguilla TaxID=7936 RepID=A0A0E9TDV3_ANGAN